MRPIPEQPCLLLIHQFEQGPHGGFAPEPYQDPAGVWTIGWGHALPDQSAAAPYPWDQTRADQQALADLQHAAEGVCAALGDVVTAKLTDGQYAACIDFAFNLGTGAFAGSTLAHFIRTGQMVLAPKEFGRWVYAKVNGVQTKLAGLVTRRAAEVAVWNGPA